MAGDDFADKVIPTARFSPPAADEFELTRLAEKPSESIVPPGIAGSYAWMECELFKLYEESTYVLVMGRVVRLEVDDAVLDAKGAFDVAKARPLMMAGTRRGMQFCTLSDIDHFEPFSAMFADGRDPLEKQYGET